MRISTDTPLVLSTWNSTARAPQHHFFSKVPDEIFYEIFHRSTHSPNAPAVQPIILSQVSRAWRALTWSAPDLWNRIRIVEDLETDTVEIDKTLQRVPHFLKLSNACPLEISICVFSYERHLGTDAPGDPYCTNLDRFRERLRILSALIAPHVARIKVLDITCDEFDAIVDLFSGVPAYTPMPLLEVLAICNTYEDETLSEDLDNPDDAQALTILLRPPGVLAETATAALYPRLSSVMLHAVPLDWSRFCPRDLEVLTLGYLARNVRPKDAVLRRILSESQDSLMSLSLSGCLLGDSWSEEGREVVAWDPLPELDHLAIGFTHPKEVISFLSAIQVPEINVLELKNIEAELTAVPERAQLPYHEESITLIQRVNWNIPLHRLDMLTMEHITFCPPPRDDISLDDVQLLHDRSAPPIPKHVHRFFSNLSSLRTLVLHDADAITLNALNYLVPENTEDPHDLRVPVPALHSLELSGTGYALLHSFFEARRKSDSYRALGLTLGIPRSWEPWLKLDNVPNIFIQDLILCGDIFESRSSTV